MMKNYKGIVLMVTLFCVNNAFAGMRPLPPAPMSNITMDAILTGALGNDAQGTPYAWKANQLYRYNYSKAMARGSANLNLLLMKDIANVNSDLSMAQYNKMMALKGTIDTLYNSLERYRSQDSQAVSQQPSTRPLPMTPALTFQSILNGALGEPFTSKAKEIYNSGTLYADALVKDLNRDVNASYTNEATRISALKATIDRLHNFMTNYLRNNQSVAQNQPVYAPAPPAVLTLQSILNGALGEPYTAKANEIYNSGVAIYVNDLNKRINTFSSGRDAANNIKNSINAVYNFLQNYRKNNPQ